MGLRQRGSVIGNYATASSNSASGIWTGKEAYTLQKKGTWQIPPTFSLTSSAANVNEGSSVNFILTTTGIPNGTVIPYTLVGANVTTTDSANNILTGNFVISNGTGTVSFNAASDVTTEGTETIQMVAAGQTANVTINDTSAGTTTDAQFPYTTLLLHGDDTNNAQNNTFLDSSANNFTITRNGNTNQGTFSPYGSNWSNYFDGTGDYLSVPNNTALNLWVGDFTIEMWVYSKANQSNYTGLVAKGGGAATGWQMVIVSNSVNVEVFGSTLFFSPSTTLPNNQWVHLAIVKSGTNVSLFQNGIRISAITGSSTSYSNTSDNVNIGTERSASIFFNGYISNIRLVKGTAVYDPTQFTLATPTSPLTTITNTSLLTCQSNRFIDNSTNNFTITKNGDATVQRFSPFSPTSAYSAATYGGSGYFDGTGDYLAVAENEAFRMGTSDFTIECWFNPPNTTGTYTKRLINHYYYAAADYGWILGVQRSSGETVQFYGFGAGGITLSSTNTLTAGAWHHLVCVRSGSVASLFLDGVRVATASGVTWNDTTVVSDGLVIGSQGGAPAGTLYDGYMAGVRIVKGTAVYDPTLTTLTVPTTPPTAISGTSFLCNFTNAGIYDNAMMTNLETIGDSKVSTTQSKFGGSAMYFDGSDYMVTQSAPTYAFGTGDFTIEAWVNPADVSGSAQKGFLQTSDTAGGLNTSYTTGVIMLFGVNDAVASLTGGVGVNIAGTWVASSTAVVTTNTWYHIALVRSSGVATLYVNGTSVASASSTGSCTGTYLCVGGYYSTGYLLNGYIDDLRITKGYARYTSNFTPPTLAYADQ